MDALILARMQFAANITFPILFPTISIGPAWRSRAPTASCSVRCTCRWR